MNVEACVKNALFLEKPMCPFDSQPPQVENLVAAPVMIFGFRALMQSVRGWETAFIYFQRVMM